MHLRTRITVESYKRSPTRLDLRPRTPPFFHTIASLSGSVSSLIFSLWPHTPFSRLSLRPRVFSLFDTIASLSGSVCCLTPPPLPTPSFTLIPMRQSLQKCPLARVIFGNRLIIALLKIILRNNKTLI